MCIDRVGDVGVGGGASAMMARGAVERLLAALRLCFKY